MVPLHKWALASVKHNGSRFGMKLLGANIPRINPKFDHFSAGSKEKIENWCKERCVIVPLRHPEKVARSWKRDGFPLADLLSSYSVMLSLAEENRFHYLPLDTPCRESRLRQIELELGHDLPTSWSVVGSDGPSPKLSLSESTRMKDFALENMGFFGRFEGYA